MAGNTQLSEEIKDRNLPQQKKSLQTAVQNKNHVVLCLEQKMVIILVLIGFGSICVSILVQIRTALQKYRDKLASLLNLPNDETKQGQLLQNRTKSMQKYTIKCPEARVAWV